MLTPESGLGPASFFRFWKTSILKRVPKKFSTCLWVATNSWVSPFKGEVGSKSDEVFNLPSRSSKTRCRFFWILLQAGWSLVRCVGRVASALRWNFELKWCSWLALPLLCLQLPWSVWEKLEIRSFFLDFVVYAINWINSLNANNHHQFIIKVLILVIIIIVLRNKIPETRPGHHLLGSPKLSSQWSLSFSTCRAMRPV